MGLREFDELGEHHCRVTTRRKTVIAIALLVTAVCTSVGAGQIRYLPEAQGTWKPWVFHAYDGNRSRVAARATDIKQLESQLLALNAILKKTPGFAAPVGFSVETVGELDLESFRPGQPALTTVPLPAMLNLGAYGVYEFERSGTIVRGDTGETAQLLFFVNQLALPSGNGCSSRSCLALGVLPPFGLDDVGPCRVGR